MLSGIVFKLPIGGNECKFLCYGMSNNGMIERIFMSGCYLKF